MDREKEIRSFVPEEYWLLNVKLSKNSENVIAKFYGNVDGKIELTNKEQVEKIIDEIDNKKYKVIDIKKFNQL